MLIGIQDELLKIESLGLLDTLLQDKTTGANIIWATDAYAQNGDAYQQDREIISGYITGANSNIIRTRVRKELEAQSARTKQHAEVFTPLWVCKMMNDYVDEMWSDEHGEVSEENWREYVDSKRMEITCGEAPFLVSRYDASTGDAIPIEERIGILDRKLKVVGEYAKTDDEWIKWAVRAFQATYGYEFQGDNVLIARVNLLMTYEEYFVERFGRKPGKSQYKKIADIIAWNIWQMDGLSGGIPFSRTGGQQLDIFEMLNGSSQIEEKIPYCMIYDWVNGQPIEYKESAGRNSEMRFDYIIGNPPYQDETLNTSDNPIYNLFMDETYKIADNVELITPARFLFRAGKTPKNWNEKMLSDCDFKVLFYEPDASKIFSNVSFKGGVAIHYRSVGRNFGCIGTFYANQELESIKEKVYEKSMKDDSEIVSLSGLVYSPESYKFTETMHKQNPEVEKKLSDGHRYDLTSNIFDKVPELFYDSKPSDNLMYAQILGLENKKRTIKYIRSEYINKVENLDSWKIFLPKSNGNGTLGEALSTPIIGAPEVGSTQTFISIGRFKSKEEAEACLKYIKTKFARIMLGIFKVTQDNKKSVWRYVPLQDFTMTSDIDWSKSISEIDVQLYRKYDLSSGEIDFIEKTAEKME